MITARYINPYFANGRKEFDLVIEDDSGVLPSGRFHRKFPDSVTQDEIDQDANSMIEWWKAQNEVVIEETVVETNVDLPNGVELEV
jgi:hypothetical protein